LFSENGRVSRFLKTIEFENVTSVADRVPYDTAGNIVSDAGSKDEATAHRRVLAKGSQTAPAGDCSNISQTRKN
jgi:hypothetical protein